jgi:hypothetical protein
MRFFKNILYEKMKVHKQTGLAFENMSKNRGVRRTVHDKKLCVTDIIDVLSFYLTGTLLKNLPKEKMHEDSLFQ